MVIFHSYVCLPEGNMDNLYRGSPISGQCHISSDDAYRMAFLGISSATVCTAITDGRPMF